MILIIFLFLASPAHDIRSRVRLHHRYAREPGALGYSINTDALG